MSNKLSQKRKPKPQKPISGEYVAYAKSQSGPLPSPQTLAEYEQLNPGTASVIFEMAQKEQNHVIKCEGDLVAASIQDVRRGQWFAFIIAMSFLLASTFCIYMDKEFAAAILGLFGVGGLVKMFLDISNKTKGNTKS